jgi:hypothetical protein
MGGMKKQPTILLFVVLFGLGNFCATDAGPTQASLLARRIRAHLQAGSLDAALDAAWTAVSKFPYSSDLHGETQTSENPPVDHVLVIKEGEGLVTSKPFRRMLVRVP